MPDSDAASESARRDEILSAARRLFSHYGFSKTTVADIAREAKVGVGSVYLEFPSKSAIIAELARRGHDRVVEAMRAVAQEPRSHADRLRAMLDVRLETMLAFAQAGQHGMELVGCVCPDAEKVQARSREKQEQLLVAFLREATAAGEFDISDPVEIARFLLRLSDAYGPETMAEIGAARAWREVAAASLVILRGLLKRA